MSKCVVESWERSRVSGHSTVERGRSGDSTAVRTRLMGMACSTIWAHGDFQIHTAPKSYFWGQGPAVVRVCVDVCDLCCHQRPWGWTWSGLTPEASLAWVVCAAIWGQVDVHDLGCFQGLCLGLWSYCSRGLCSWSVLPPQDRWKPMICGPTDCEGQWYQWLQMPAAKAAV